MGLDFLFGTNPIRRREAEASKNNSLQGLMHPRRLVVCPNLPSTSCKWRGNRDAETLGLSSLEIRCRNMSENKKQTTKSNMMKKEKINTQSRDKKAWLLALR